MRLDDEMEPIIDELRSWRQQLPLDVSEVHLPSFNAGWRCALDRLMETLHDRETRQAAPYPTPAAAASAPSPVPPAAPASAAASDPTTPPAPD